MEHLAAFAEAHGSPASLAYEYTSPLTGQPDRFVRLQSISSEHAMVCGLPDCQQSILKLHP